MSRFIESIACHEGQYPLLHYHQKRVNHTFENFFHGQEPISLHELLEDIKPKGRSKVRIVYNNDTIQIDHAPYHPRQISSIQLVAINIDYAFKFEDRSALNHIYDLRGKCDDIIMVKNGAITDSYYANVCFWNGKEWVTPKSHLLNGVKRQYLLDQGLIKEANITQYDLSSFEKVTLINAMLNPGEITVPINSIVS